MPMPQLVMQLTLCRVVAAVSLLAPATGWGAQLTESETEAADLLRGIALGDYFIREYHPIQGQKSELSFTLYGVVADDEFDSVEKLVANRQHKIRDQVITASRVLALEDFDDPKLVKLRRRILLRLGRTVPKLTLQDVLVTQFSFSLGE